MEAFLFISVLIIFIWVGLANAQKVAEAKAQAMSAFDSSMKAAGIDITYQYHSPDAHAFIAIDEAKGKLLLNIGDPKAHVRKHSLDLYKILSIEVSENGKSLFSDSSDLSGRLTGAALGGVVFGGAGAVVGAMAGKDKSQVTNIDLTLQMADPAVPYIKFNFLGNTKVKAGSAEHIKALDNAKTWVARVRALQSQRHPG